MLQGTDFGPDTPSASDLLRVAGFVVRYANGSLVATRCSVTVPHVAVTCLTAPGTGTSHGWQLSIASQWSNVHFEGFGVGAHGTSYAPPTISYFEYQAAPYRGVKDFLTQGAEQVRTAVAF